MTIKTSIPSIANIKAKTAFHDVLKKTKFDLQNELNNIKFIVIVIF